MSTEDQNRAVVTFEKGVDVEQAVNQLLDAGYELYDEKLGSRRNFDFVMTQEQAAELRKDPRITDVRYGSKKENGIFLTRAVIEDQETYEKSGTINSSQRNWAFPACTNQANPFGTNSTYNYQYAYTLDGEGVDIVIQDSGIETDHPEWLAKDGVTSRYQSIDWPSAAGLSGTYTQPAQHERDIDGHGTHVAGTAAGRLYGWAKGANIYSNKILDDPGQTYGVSASFNLIRGWHNNKTNGRPTVVNMSWGYFAEYVDITNGNWRGTNWTDTLLQQQYGMVQGQQSAGGNWTFPVRVASVDADIQDCLDDGIILVGAAGNDSHKADVAGGLDYNNYWENSLGQRSYYHRGSTPMGQPGVISVGNVSHVYVNNQEPLFNSSTKGPRVDVSAPGGQIISAIPIGSTIAITVGSVNYPLNASYAITKISGTSMASPQVAGIAACIAGSRKNLTPGQMKDFLIDKCTATNRLYDSTTGTPSTDYNDFRALQGGPNKYIVTPFTSDKVFVLNNGLDLSS
jgi:subtilisin family serine protease